MTKLNIQITAQHQAIAARLGLAVVDGDPDRVDAALSEAASAGLDATLAVLAVQSQSLAAVLMAHQGTEAARAAFQRTILDAGLADDD